VPISSDVLFAFGKAELTETARRQKAALADRLTDVEGVVVIEGHTDAVGSAADNLRLSRRHTDAVEKEPARLVPGVRTRTVGVRRGPPGRARHQDGKDYPEGRGEEPPVTIIFRERQPDPATRWRPSVREAKRPTAVLRCALRVERLRLPAPLGEVFALGMRSVAPIPDRA